MARARSKHPTELELEILKVIWRDGACSVRQVREALAGERDLAATSVTTVMNIMIDKGYLSRAKVGGVYVYRAVVGEGATSRGMLADLVDRVFDGSRVAAAINLLGSGRLDEEEIRQIRRLLDRRSKRRKK